MLRGIQNRSQTFRDWCRQVDLILDCVGEDKAGINTVHTNTLILLIKKREYRDGIKRKETRLGWS